MPPTAPKAPAEPDWDLLKQKKPTLSQEHVESIAELSEAYLNPEAAEFTESTPVENLCSLYELSMQKPGRMSKKDEQRLQKIVLSAFAKSVRPLAEGTEGKKDGPSAIQKRSSAEMMLSSTQIIQTTRLDEKARIADNTARLLRIFDQSISACNAMEDGNFKHNRLIKITNALLEGGYPKEALKAARRINMAAPPRAIGDPSFHADMVKLYSKIGLDLAQSGLDPSEAFQKAKAAFEYVSTRDDALTERDNYNMARHYSQPQHELDSSRDFHKSRDDVLLALSSSQSKAGLFEDAMESASHIKNVSVKANALCNAALEMKQTGADPSVAMKKAREAVNFSRAFRTHAVYFGIQKWKKFGSDYDGVWVGKNQQWPSARSMVYEHVEAYAHIIAAEGKLGADASKSAMKAFSLAKMLIGKNKDRTLEPSMAYLSIAMSMHGAGLDPRKAFEKSLSAVKRRDWGDALVVNMRGYESYNILNSNKECDMYLKIALAMKDAGLDPAKPLSLAEKSDVSIQKTFPLILAQAKCGLFDSALSNVKRMAYGIEQHLRHNCEDFNPRNIAGPGYALCEIALAQAKAGLFKEASGTLSQVIAQKTIYAHDEKVPLLCGPKHQTRLQILVLEGKAGNDVRAPLLQLAEEFPGSHIVHAMLDIGICRDEAIEMIGIEIQKAEKTDKPYMGWAASLISLQKKLNGNAMETKELLELLEFARANRDEALQKNIGILLPISAIKSLEGKERDMAADEKTSLHNIFSMEEEERNMLFDAYKSQLLEHGASLKSPQRLKLAIKVLFNLDKITGEKNSAAFFMQVAREAKDKRTEARLLYALSDVDSYKAKDLVMRVACSGALDDRVSWLLISKLIGSGYLDPDLGKFYADGQKGGLSRKFLLQATQKSVSKMGLTPDPDLLKYLVTNAKTKENLDKTIDETNQYREQFDAEKDKDKLARVLSQDKRKALLFYMLNCGRTHFSLINNYDSGKFSHALGAVSGLKVHEPVLDAVVSAFPKERQAEIKGRMLSGSFPLGGSYSADIRVDVPSSEQLMVIEEEASGVFGKGELGVILKAGFYMEKLKGSALASDLAACNGLSDAFGVIQKIEAAHPEIVSDIDKKLGKTWNRMGEKQVLFLTLQDVLANERNRVDIKQTLSGLETQRKSLKSAVRQQYQSEAIPKELRDERLGLLEEKGRAKLLRFIFEDMASTKSELETRIFEEWESHLAHVLNSYDSISQSDLRLSKNREVTLVYLDKRQDLVESLRFADAAQCCFTSAHNDGGHKWVTRVWKDPLYFSFGIFDKVEPGAKTRNSVGFVFGSVGVHKGKPALFLNGVYMEGKTGRAVQSILAQIERDFARPLECTMMFVGSRYGGTAKLGPSYSNKAVEFTRARALESASGKPEAEIYDDLTHGGGKAVNSPMKTDASIWHKSL